MTTSDTAAIPLRMPAALADGRPPAAASVVEARYEPMRTLGAESDVPWKLYDLHTDHLGSVRVITGPARQVTSRHDFFPFGEELQLGVTNNTHAFTGHEQDEATGLEYSMARYLDVTVSRFLSPDPAAQIVKSQGRPARWNRYSYVLNNPLIYIDPQGETLTLTGDKKALDAFVGAANEGLNGKKLQVDDNGNATLVDDPNEQGPSTPEQESLEATLNDAIEDDANTAIAIEYGNSKTGTDSYYGKSFDIRDALQYGNGPGASTSGFIAHAVAEQHAGQTQGLWGSLGYTVAHEGYGVPAENGATGYRRGEDKSHLTAKDDVVNGTVTTPYSRGNQTINVTTYFKEGNADGVTRK